MSTFITRRAMLKFVAVTSSVGVLAACQPQVVKETVVVEKEKVVEKPVEKVVEKEVTKVVEKEKVVKETVVVQEPAKKEPITLQVWSAWQSQAVSKPTWDELLTRWAAKYPDVTLKDTAVPGSQDEQMQKVAAAVASGTPPDVWANTSPMTWGGRGMLVPLNAYADVKGNWDPKDWYQNMLDHYTVRADGTLYGLMHDSDSRGLYWRTDFFEEAGLDPKVPPKTWSELRAMAQKLTVKNGDFYDRMGFIPTYGEAWVEEWIGQAGGWPLLDWSKMPPAWRLNTPQAVKATTFMRDMSDDYGGVKVINTFREGFQADASEPYLTGQLAMWVSGPWHLASIAKYAPDLKFDVTSEPIADEGGTKATLSGGWGWSVPIGSKFPSQGYDFISHLTEHENLSFWNDKTAHIPPKRSVGQDAAFSVGHLKFFTEAMSWNGSWPGGPWTRNPAYSYSNALDDILLHSKEPQVALDEAQKEAQAISDEYYGKK